MGNTEAAISLFYCNPHTCSVLATKIFFSYVGGHVSCAVGKAGIYRESNAVYTVRSLISFVFINERIKLCPVQVRTSYCYIDVNVFFISELKDFCVISYSD